MSEELDNGEGGGGALQGGVEGRGVEVHGDIGGVAVAERSENGSPGRPKRSSKAMDRDDNDKEEEEEEGARCH